ncbi:MAG: hypothetical protein IJT44_09455 [Clostridia bacterium]|nr:hypothetical protein [Clostridia bacterium]
MKRILAALTAALLCFGCMTAGFAADGVPARLYSIYGDNMLFQQKKTAVFAGVATGGIHVTCTLLDSAGNAVAKGEGAVNKSGRFSVGIPAPAGGYAEYTAVLALEGAEFARLRGVVFGELWLSSGQSNMQMHLGATETGIQMQAGGQTCSSALRFLQEPPLVEFGGDTERFPDDPQRDVPGSVWVRGDDPSVFGVSAVSVLFAQQLQKTLDMPVGVLSASLGGSSIYTWLSRSAIESDPEVLKDLQQDGRYTAAEDWQESGHDVYLDMTTNYNKKISALRVFSPRGLIWYQGETEIFRDTSPQAYARAFDLLQRSWSELFGYSDDARLPVVNSQIAAYSYGGDRLQSMNAGFADMQRSHPQSRAVTPIYDVPLTYRQESGVIHPTEKDIVGARMAYAAEGLVYGLRDTYTAATVQSAVPENGGVTVTLRDTGSGLICKQGKLRGFSVCGRDGVFVQADARIVDRDTLFVSAEQVPQPVAAAYAFGEVNARANLYASDENGAALPVSPFVTDPSVMQFSWQGKEWTDCDSEKLWRLAGETTTGYYDAWSVDHASLSYGGGEADRYLCVQPDARSFSVYPTAVCRDGSKDRQFRDARPDWRYYGKLAFRVRNTGAHSVKLRQVRLYTSATQWYAPLVDGTHGASAVIPADGEWHTVTLDLSQIFRAGNVCGVTYSRAKLGSVRQMRLCFSGEKDGKVELDDFRFTPDGTEGAARRFIPRFDRARTPWEWLSALAMQIVALFVR